MRSSSILAVPRGSAFVANQSLAGHLCDYTLYADWSWASTSNPDQHNHDVGFLKGVSPADGRRWCSLASSRDMT